VQAPPGSYRAASWPEDAHTTRPVNPGTNPAGDMGAAAEKLGGVPWRQRLPGIKADFDGGLRNVVKDVLLLLSDQQVRALEGECTTTKRVCRVKMKATASPLSSPHPPQCHDMFCF